MVGPRPTMEDIVSITSKSPDEVMIALFDGHAGFGAAKCAASFMEKEFLETDVQDEEAVPSHIIQSFKNVQKKLYEEDAEGGCTCALSLI